MLPQEKLSVSSVHRGKATESMLLTLQYFPPPPLKLQSQANVSIKSSWNTANGSFFSAAVKTVSILRWADIKIYLKASWIPIFSDRESFWKAVSIKDSIWTLPFALNYTEDIFEEHDLLYIIQIHNTRENFSFHLTLWEMLYIPSAYALIRIQQMTHKWSDIIHNWWLNTS